MFIEKFDLYSPDRRHNAKLVVDGVCKTFGGDVDAVQALAPCNIALELGDFLCVVGPSGCGKTTLLNIIGGFEKPSGGRARLDGKPIVGPGDERGVVFQQGALFNWMSVLNNVAFGPRACGIPPGEAREKARAMLEMVGLGGFESKYPYQLSGGMQQRVGIARALVNDPEVLLMDEPFASLDQQTRELLQEEVQTIWRRTGKTVLWITHSIEEALFLATHIVVMSSRPGRIKATFRSHFSKVQDPLVGSTPEFAAAKRQIVGLLRPEALVVQRQGEPA